MFPRSIRIWNTLPNNAVTSSSIAGFRGAAITHHTGHVATPRTKDAVREGHTCTTFALHLAHCIYTPSMSPRSPQYITGAPAALDTAHPSPGQRSRFWESNSSRFKVQGTSHYQPPNNAIQCARNVVFIHKFSKNLPTVGGKNPSHTLPPLGHFAPMLWPPVDHPRCTTVTGIAKMHKGPIFWSPLIGVKENFKRGNIMGLVHMPPHIVTNHLTSLLIVTNREVNRDGRKAIALSVCGHRPIFPPHFTNSSLFLAV